MDYKLIFAIAIIIGFTVFFANRSAYYPMKYPEGFWEIQGQAGVEDAWIDSPQNRLHGWWKSQPGARFATLFLHGNAGNVTHRGIAIEEITAAGSSILVLDYRGYGKSSGRPTESGLYRDADQSYNYLISKGWKADKIVIHGESLGCAVAVDLASRRQCAGVILEAPFPSARAVAARVLPLVGPLLVWGFDAKSKIRSVKAPILIIHGGQDEIINYALGRELYEAAPEPKQLWTVPGAGHNNIADIAGTEYRARLKDFYAALAARVR